MSGCHGDILRGKKDVSAKILAKHLTQSRYLLSDITEAVMYIQKHRVNICKSA